MARHTTIPRPKLNWIHAPRRETGQQLGVSDSTLKRWRKSGAISEGIHWIYQPGTKARILYNLDLMRDWLVNSDSPAHQRAINRYMDSLPSSK